MSLFELNNQSGTMEKWTRLIVIVSAMLLLLLAVGVMIWLMAYIHHTLLLFALGMLLAYALDPLVTMLCQRPLWSFQGRRFFLPRGAAVAIVLIAFLAVAVVGIAAMVRPLNHQIRLLRDPKQQALFREHTQNLLAQADAVLAHGGLHVNLSGYVRDPSTIPASVRSSADTFERRAFEAFGGFLIGVGESIVVLLIAVYLLIYGSEMRIRFNAKLPPNLLIHAVVWEEDVNRIIGGFVRGQFIIALVLGVASALGCWAVGIHLWLLVGLFVVVAALIPVFGPYIGTTPAIILALATPTRIENRVIAAIVILVVFIIINEFGSKILYPRLVGRAIGLHEVVVLFALFAGLEVGGVVGVLFAAPVTAIAIATVVHLYRFWLDLPDSLVFAQKLPESRGELSEPAPVEVSVT